MKVVRKKAAPSPLKPWGIVFEYLREHRGMQKGEVADLAGLDRPGYRHICYKLKMGPSHKMILRLLFALRASMEEYGRLYDALNRGSMQEAEELHRSASQSRRAHRASIDALARGDTSMPKRIADMRPR